MNKRARLVAGALVLAMGAGAFAACAKKKTEKGATSAETSASAGATSAAASEETTAAESEADTANAADSSAATSDTIAIDFTAPSGSDASDTAGGAAAGQPSAANVDLSLADFSEAELIKIGEHTYYDSNLLYRYGREDDREHISELLEAADASLHDDTLVCEIHESEYKDEFWFYGKMMINGYVYDSATMMAFYEPETGNVWDYDIAHFRRSDPKYGKILPMEDLNAAVYEAMAKYMGNKKISGTYLLKVDGFGEVFYEYRIGRWSFAQVNAYTGEIIMAIYDDGIRT
ncbi:MAG: hypothetical protein J6040_06130 [Clostridiales bacterium]|nr:hypothetical protein [Clostridiales bacterium]